MKKDYLNCIFRSLWGLVAVALVAVAGACSEDVPEPTPESPETPEVPEAPEEPAPVQGGRSRKIELTAQQQGFVDATIDMSFKMFEALNLQERDVEALGSALDRPVDNIVFSPLGASYAAMALANGAEHRHTPLHGARDQALSIRDNIGWRPLRFQESGRHLPLSASNRAFRALPCAKNMKFGGLCRFFSLSLQPYYPIVHNFRNGR